MRGVNITLHPSLRCSAENVAGVVQQLKLAALPGSASASASGLTAYFKDFALPIPILNATGDVGEHARGQGAARCADNWPAGPPGRCRCSFGAAPTAGVWLWCTPGLAHPSGHPAPCLRIPAQMEPLHFERTPQT